MSGRRRSSRRWKCDAILTVNRKTPHISPKQTELGTLCSAPPTITTTYTYLVGSLETVGSLDARARGLFQDQPISQEYARLEELWGTDTGATSDFTENAMPQELSAVQNQNFKPTKRRASKSWSSSAVAPQHDTPLPPLPRIKMLDSSLQHQLVRMLDSSLLSALLRATIASVLACHNIEIWGHIYSHITQQQEA
jgi:hypothetical protein